MLPVIISQCGTCGAEGAKLARVRTNWKARILKPTIAVGKPECKWRPRVVEIRSRLGIAVLPSYSVASSKLV
jgi:hypothetical protein